MKLSSEYINDITSENTKTAVTFVNPHSYFILKDALLDNSFDCIYADGILVCIMECLFGYRLISRKSFDYTSIAPSVFEHCNSMRFNILVVGSTEDSLDKFISLLERQYPNIKFFSRNGFFSSDEQVDQYLASISDNFFHVVIAGMGTPLQERFILRCKEVLDFNKAFTCGGFISQTTERLNYYPAIINFFKLRVPYRFIFERHVRKRYLISYPKFFIRYISDKINNKS